MATTLVIPNADFSAHKIETVVFGAIPCTGISLDQQTKSLTSLSPFTLTATPVPANTTDSVVWSTSDDTVATVSEGVVTPLKLGTVTITATCGTQTANCSVDISFIPDYVVVGAFRPYKVATNNKCNAGNQATDTAEYKFGIVAANNSDTSKKIIDAYGGTNEGNFRFVPIPLCDGAKRVKIKSKRYSGSTLLSMKTNFLWFDSTAASGGSSGAKCLAGNKDNTWDQDTLSTEIIVNIPDNLQGLDSFAIGIQLSDWSIKWNTDYAQYFDILILPDEAN